MFPDTVWVWNLFQLLSETRDYGFGGPLRIKLSELKAALELRGIHHDLDVSFATRTIPQLDSIWLDDHYRQAKANKGKGGR